MEQKEGLLDMNELFSRVAAVAPGMGYGFHKLLLFDGVPCISEVEEDNLYVFVYVEFNLEVSFFDGVPCISEVEENNLYVSVRLLVELLMV
jgi:hypothetical protein